ncbi:glycosyltransferase family 4 protein [Synechococcus sp. CB0101]|uniref:glycosyltransferase family 4 protein n=1 Tax=Synechococcus sp. CB0101 TaxID=232348 RepID=UPI0002001974|nr:glycosyltransferase family 4 protein [Synechococcus sp. CB0101]
MQIDLVHTNPNLLQADPCLLHAADLTAPLRIGYWAWELEAFPEGWESFLSSYDEIWCPSPFTAQALAQRSPIPVVSVPHYPDWPRLQVLQDRRRDRRPQAGRAFRFLCLFDFWSTTERKNPDGVIEAFWKAFPPGSSHLPPVELLIKTSSAEQFPAACNQLMAKTADDPRIHWQHQLLSSDDLDELLLSADVLVSLHRSEGFGLVLADAMAIGLPVMATAYSGNLEFMPQGSAALIPWQLIPIEHTSGDYRRGWLWADPDLNAAAAWMRDLASDPQVGARLAARGAVAVRERLSFERLAPVVRQRLGTLLLKPTRRELLNTSSPVLQSLG